MQGRLEALARRPRRALDVDARISAIQHAYIALIDDGEGVFADANWGDSTATVYQFCRQSPHAAVLRPSHGRGVGPDDEPLGLSSDRKQKKAAGVRLGLNWEVRPSKRRKVRYVLYDTNFWKTFVHHRLAVPPAQDGCFDLYGTKRTDHRIIGEHLTAEHPIRKKGKKRTVDVWQERPNRDNHFLDLAVGCHVAASILGAALPGTGAAPRRKRRARRVRYLE